MKTQKVFFFYAHNSPFELLVDGIRRRLRLKPVSQSKERIIETQREIARRICRGNKAVEERVFYPDDCKERGCGHQHCSENQEEVFG